ncbi:amidohydrolase [Herbiconiux sp. CPCC 203407]|uniref:Amidohydrolase n=1 Tax=Herbiconiux oxytropis TaxID=2970915 RepID=A0AA41XJH6_9MICO|nr:amidohydrolase [Herbiconiux oxytropis]MCS5722355.1 amidohydrolase [Herbiconiux oxytropis]MCS5727248.1 amidohydrolase [Herbiconiux oxytropis]
MTRILITHGMVLTLDDEGTYLEDGTVVIDGDRIVWIGPAAEAPSAAEGDDVIDATDKIVMPGLIDLHFHTALGKGYNDHLPLWEYLDECWYPLIRALDFDSAYWAAMASYTESIKAGVTTVNDMYRKLDALAVAAEQIGIRVVLSNDIALDEYRLDTLQDNVEAFHRSHGSANGLIEVRFGIEWLPLASPELLRETRGLADELGIGIHIHLNESMSEVENSLERFGKRPTELAYEVGLLGPDVVAAHCVHLNDDEIRMMAETGTHISHNPSSNAKLGNGIARVPEMLAAGINVGLGHDAVECNNSADMFEVMKYSSLMHRAQRQDSSLMPAADVLRMATRNGAKALGHETGQLAVGAKADVILVETNSVEFTPMLRDTPVHMTSHLVFAANGGMVDTTIVNGRVLMRGRELTTVDESEVVRKTNEAFRRTVERMEVVHRPA